MSKLTFSSKWGKVRMEKKAILGGEMNKTAQDIVREIKTAQKLPMGEDYREKSLAIHGLHCARCGREFDESNRSLLTVHHKDGNHDNNPTDGSNWENLCVYCHEDVHSRGLLADYLGKNESHREFSVVYESQKSETGVNLLAEKLKKALQKK